MIIYSLWFYEVDARRIADFAAAFCDGGIVYELSRRFQGHIYTDLLSRTEDPSGRCRLLSISFFTSIEALLLAERSAQMSAIAQWLREQTKQCIHLGTFSHFPRQGEEIPSVKTLDQLRTEITPLEVRR